MENDKNEEQIKRNSRFKNFYEFCDSETENSSFKFSSLQFTDMKLLGLILAMSLVSISDARRKKKKNKQAVAINDEQRSAQIQLLDLEVQEGIIALTPFQTGAGKFSGKIKNCIRVLGESDLGMSGNGKKFYDDCKNFIVSRNHPKIIGNLRKKQCQVIELMIKKNQDQG